MECTMTVTDGKGKMTLLIAFYLTICYVLVVAKSVKARIG